jgi:hypothetical protein
MRKPVLSAIVGLVFCMWTSGAHAQDPGTADLEDFALDTGQDLADLCAVEQGDALYPDGKLFCYGVIEGVISYHDAMGRGPDGDLLVCPEGDVTREDTLDMFVTWAQANPEQAGRLWPAEAVIAAALETWGPCQQ